MESQVMEELQDMTGMMVRLELWVDLVLQEIRLTLISTVTTMMTINMTMALTTTPYLHHQELPAN